MSKFKIKGANNEEPEYVTKEIMKGMVIQKEVYEDLLKR